MHLSQLALRHDPAGLAITARLHRLGVRTWRMGRDDYVAAVIAAEDQQVELPVSDADVPATPWDPMLQHEFAARCRQGPSPAGDAAHCHISPAY